ncbi:MAG: LuxR family transcriptional regulator [Leptonema sp. (in: Bacteria)]|nr:LuxR family transcriptional regulator [Leptonema sp. (in: bacteria)]
MDEISAIRTTQLDIKNYLWPKSGMILIIALIFLNIYDSVYHYITDSILTIHQISEIILVSIITVHAIYLLIRHRQAVGFAGQEIERIQKEADNAWHEAARIGAEMNRYRTANKDILHSMRQAMNDQFNRWSFSPEEKRAALLIIQGLTFREIAGRLNKSEKTIRNQSLSIYEKAGMTGRHDLAAFFLLDILDIDE